MNHDQAAHFLRVSRATLDRWIRQGLLAEPGLSGDHFDRAALEAWARRRGVEVRAAHEVPALTPANLLAEAVERGMVQTEFEPLDARGAIERAMSGLNLPLDTKAVLLEATLDRERLASTALGHGYAMPHPRNPNPQWLEQAWISVLFLAKPIDWAALDGLPVHTVFLVLSPTTPVHLQILSRIAFSLRTPGFDDLLASRPDHAALVVRLRALSRQG